MRDFFATQRLVNAATSWPRRWPGFEDLRDLLHHSTLEVLPLLAAGSSPRLQEISRRAWDRGDRSPALRAQMAIGALARRDYPQAAEHFAAAAAPGGPEALGARLYQTFALLMAERAAEARQVLDAVGPTPAAASPTEQQGLRWLHAMLEAPDR
jgi:hypothetical protein